ncbi:MAG: acetolactate synthase [Acidobacteria bacterium RIFCSPLOWO2_12_FULL_67_14b]|nr:MAG: acetolactate synthase [Acidobacteria bacterium RIFCSPLOWO2_12_FULL_67_14b]
MQTEEEHITGGQALAKMLLAAGAGPIFGMGGFQFLPFYDAARRLGLVHHLINDERVGVFAADAYARVSGRPGLCDGTLGPGAMNLVTGLAESLNAGVPLVALVSDTHRAHSWKNMTQECRQIEVLRPVVKEVIRVERIDRIPELVRRAFAVATSGRAGPVLLDFPEDVVHGEHSFDSAEFRIEEATTRAPSRRSRPAASDTERAAKHLASARRPLLLVGGGVHLSGAHAELAALARQEAIPVAHTMSGKGSMACTDPLSVGLFGRFDRIANGLIAGSDCLLVVGCKLGEIATKRFTLMPQGVPLIHLDILGEEFGRTTEPDVALCGDASEGLRDLLAALEDGAAQRRLERQPYLAEVERRKEGWQVFAQPRYTSAEVPVNMGRLIGELRRALPAQGIVVADGGFAAHWTGLLFDTQVAGRSYVANRGLASIGYGLPGAVGAKLARPDVPVVAITGDGGFNMTLGDLETARRVGADVVIVVVNNAASGYVKSLQHSMYGPGNYQSSDLVEMDYARIAESMGCRGLRVQTPDALSTAFATALAVRGMPTVIDVCVTRDPGQMLPATDSRAMKVTPGDRPV